jgi:hypothetical protein
VRVDIKRFFFTFLEVNMSNILWSMRICKRTFFPVCRMCGYVNTLVYFYLNIHSHVRPKCPTKTKMSDQIVGLRECWLSNLSDILGGICRTWEYDRDTLGVGKQEIGIWWVQKRYPQYGIPIWSLWPNIRFLPSIVAEKNATKNILGRTGGQK